jgi:hypothetical protein
MRSLLPKAALAIACVGLGWVSALTFCCSGYITLTSSLYYLSSLLFLAQSQCRLAYMHRQRTYDLYLANVKLILCAFRLLRFG